MSHAGIDSAALDRYITGNYGEDQYRDYWICDSCDKNHLEDCGKDPSSCVAEARDDHKAEEADRRLKER